ncbi:hypothetical protein ABT234_40570 [Streptomyces sp. NPDC001586]|uniref:hypothetical protein n=1 Tax=Streptomyces sp. NPDC001586 TaxID=3154387 RepID=UPI003318C6CA
MVDDTDGERQQVILHDVNQDNENTSGSVDLLREQVLSALGGPPNLGSAASGPAGETQPGFAVVGTLSSRGRALTQVRTTRRQKLRAKA